MVTALQEGDHAAFGQINQAVFFRYPATPATFQFLIATALPLRACSNDLKSASALAGERSK
jgi:hypothetical protein